MATFRYTIGGGRGAPPGIGGRIVGSLFFLAFTGIGLAVTATFAASMMQGYAPWRWDAAECRVLSSRVEDLLFSLPLEEAAKESEPYRLAVGYEWERDGRSYRGEGIGASAQYRSRLAAVEAAARYAPGSVVRCYVDPQDPTQAALRRPRLWALLLLGFPLIFVVIGLGGLVAMWSRSRKRPAGAVVEPRSEKKGSGARPGCMAAAFSIFAIAGGAFLLFFILPIARKVASHDWEKVPATIVWSGVGTHSGSNGGTYSVDVVYEYDRGGERYRANRYGFIGGSSSGEAEKQEVVARMPPGARVDAWVDPDDPSSAVLERKLGPFVWFATLPLVFVLVGVGGIVFALRSGRKRNVIEWLPEAGAVPTGSAAAVATYEAAGATVREVSASGASGAMAGAGLPAVAQGPVTLKPAKSRVGGFIAMLLFTLVWDGVVGLAIWAVNRDGKLFNDGCITVFLGVFALVGVLLLISLPRQFLALFNPRAELTLSAPVAPGMPAALSWRFEGATSRISHLVLSVEGHEEATYRQGTRSTTDRRTFARIVLLDTSDPATIAGGETVLGLPPDTMHTFRSAHNKVLWTLQLKGEIANWPDIEDQVALVVYPAGLLG